MPEEVCTAVDAQSEEMRRREAELKRVTEARDTLEKGDGVLHRDIRVRDTLIVEMQNQFPMRRQCKVLEVHPRGFYAWRLSPKSRRAKEDKRLLVPIKEFWMENGSVYGYRTVCDDLR